MEGSLSERNAGAAGSTPVDCSAESLQCGLCGAEIKRAGESLFFILLSKVIVMLWHDASDISENNLHFLSEGSRLHCVPLMLSEPQGPQQAVITTGDQEKCEPCNLDRRSSSGTEGKTAGKLPRALQNFTWRSIIYHHLALQTEWKITVMI